MPADDVEVVVVDVKGVARGYRVRSLIGSNVYLEQGEAIGRTRSSIG
jgi:hypothetical protein